MHYVTTNYHIRDESVNWARIDAEQLVEAHQRICNQPVWKQVNTRDILVVWLIMLMMLSIGRIFWLFSHVPKWVRRVRRSPALCMFWLAREQYCCYFPRARVSESLKLWTDWNSFDELPRLRHSDSTQQQTVELHQHHHNFPCFTPHTLILGENMRKWFNLHINLLSQHNNLWLE